MNVMRTLAEVCKMTGITRRAIQGYEKMGLVVAKEKNKYGHLLYGNEEIKRIEKIKLYQELGFKLREIKEIITAPDDIVKFELQQKVTFLETEVEAKRRVILQVKKIIEELP